MSQLQEGRTTLMVAIENGHEPVVKELLEPIYQCDTNIQEKVELQFYCYTAQWKFNLCFKGKLIAYYIKIDTSSSITV